jgi:hypothetical protein
MVAVRVVLASWWTLPDPLGPRKPVTLPGRTSKLSASTATVVRIAS